VLAAVDVHVHTLVLDRGGDELREQSGRLVLHESHYRIEESLAGDDVFRPGSFPGLEIPLVELWRLPGHAG